MSAASDETSDDSFDGIIKEYLRATNREGPQDHQKWFTRYPQFAEQLSVFFGDSAQALSSTVVAPSVHLPVTASYDDEAVLARPVREAEVAAGTLLDGKYRVLSTKQGGMGRIYFVTGKANRGDKPKAALKTVIPFRLWRARFRDLSTTELAVRYAQLLYRFRREAMNWIRLPEHPNLITAVWVHEIAGHPYLFLDYADSGDLSDWIRCGKLTIPLAVDFALQFCSGMMHATSSAGLVHRDIKPANVLVHQDQQVKITDLGLARAFALDESAVVTSPSQDDLSSPGGGSLPYMAPEQAESLANADTRSDIFSFGATLFEMLTRKRLFAETNAYNAKRKRLAIPAAHDVNEAVPPDLSAVVARCVEYDRERRFGSFDDVAQALMSTGLAQDWSSGRLRSQEVASVPQLRDWNREVFALLSLGQYEAAVQLGQQAIDAEPQKSGHWLNQGKAFIELGDFVESHQCYAKAAELNPDKLECWFNVSYALLGLARPAEGLQTAERALMIDANSSQAWDAAGLCHHEMKDIREAQRCFHRALDADGYNWRTWLNLGHCLVDLGKVDEALAALERSVSINAEHAQTWFQLGSVRAMREEYAEALAAIENAVQLDAQHAASWGMHGVVLTQLGANRDHLERAADSFRRALSLDPTIEMARQLLVEVEAQLD